jgi:hypothetical protein
MANSNVESSTVDLLNALQDAKDKNLAKINQITSYGNTIQQAGSDEEAQALLGSSGRDASGGLETPTTIAVRGAANQRAEEQNNTFTSALGINMADPNETVTAKAAALQVANAQLLQSGKNLQDNINLKFMDNPAQWVMNAFSIGHDTEAVAAAKEQRDAIAAGMLKNNELATAQGQTNLANRRLNTDASIQSQVDASHAFLQTAKDALTIKNAATGIQTVMQLGSLDAQGLGYVADAQKAFLANDGNEMMHQHLQLAKAQAAREAVTFGDAQDDRSAVASIVANAQAGLAAMGFDPTKTSMQFPLKNMVALYKSGDPYVRDLVQKGMLAQQTGMTVIGDTEQTAAYIRQYHPPGQPAQKPIVAAYNAAIASVSGMSSLAFTQEFKTNQASKGAIDAAAAQRVTTKANNWLENIDPADQTNPYGMPDLQTMYGAGNATTQNLPGFKAAHDSVLAQKVIIPNMLAIDPQNRIKPTDMAQIFTQGLAAVKAGIITQDDLVTGMVAAGQSGMIYNNGVKHPAGVGLPLQSGTKVTIPSGVAGGNHVVDLTDKSAVSLAISKARFTENALSRFGNQMLGGE